jgi:hypothetical protein
MDLGVARFSEYLAKHLDEFVSGQLRLGEKISSFHLDSNNDSVVMVRFTII